MEKYKIRKIPYHFNSRTLGLILLIVGVLLYLSIPIITADYVTSYDYDQPINTQKILEDFAFDGTLTQQYNYDDKYLLTVYTKNNKNTSHFIDINKNTEVKFEDLIKNDKEKEYKQKVNNLLAQKYPNKIVNMLDKTKKTYQFNEDELLITYEKPKDLKINRELNLKVNYNEIEDYLKFETNSDENYQNESGYIYDPNKVSVAFSFDDGPNNKKTKKLISSLEDYKMSASFFMVVNKMESDSDTVKLVNNSHSEVGYHSYAHQDFTKQKPDDIKKEYIKSNEILKNITNETFKITRPPYGSYNEKVLESIDNPFIRWDLDTNDWKYRDVDYIFKYVTENYKDGSIILFHDSYDTSVSAAIKLMDYFYMNDVQVMSVSELAKIKNIKLENNEVYYSFTK